MMKSMDTDCRAQLDVSFVQLSALMALSEQDNCLMKDLANTLMLDNSAITGLSKRMVDHDLITRTPCEQDSRASRLSMTKKGQTVLKKGLVLLQQGNQLMQKDFSEQELDTVSRYLQHLNTVFSERS